MTTTTNSRPMRKDVLYLKPSEIVEEEGFNVRINYGNIEELAASILENGVKVPLRGFKRGGEYVLTDGHRRLRACSQLEKLAPELKIPFIVDKSERSMEQRVIDVMICNDGLHLNPLEEAEAVNRLLNYNMTEQEISQKTGKSGVYISNLKLLHAAPKKIKEWIMGDVVSATLAMEVLRRHENFADAIAELETAVRFAEAQNKTKVTKRDLEKSKGKVNSVSMMRKLFKKDENRIVKESSVELYAFGQKLLAGEYTKEDLDELFYEPAEEGDE